MQYARWSLASLFLLPSAGSFDPDVSLRYAPAEGTVLQRTFRQQADVVLDNLYQTVDGIEEEIHPAGELMVTTDELVVVTDEILAVGNGRPLRLRRSFDELSGTYTESVSTSEDDDVFDLVSDFDDVTVLITWDEEAGEYTFAAEEDEGVDPALLARMHEDMDLRLFLPEDECAVGDSWDVPAEAYVALMYPGGVVGLHQEGAEADDSFLETARLRIEGLSGAGEATLLELREEEDRTLAVIDFEFELLYEMEYEFDSNLPGVTSAVASVTKTERHDGELRWDVTHGHVHSLADEIEAQAERITHWAMAEQESSTRQVVSSNETHEVRVERQ